MEEGGEGKKGCWSRSPQEDSVTELAGLHPQTIPCLVSEVMAREGDGCRGRARGGPGNP